MDLLCYFFRICNSDAWFYFRYRGRSFIDGLPWSIKRWKNEFIWLNASCFPFRNVFQAQGTIKDKQPQRMHDLSDDISKISSLSVSMNFFLEVMLAQADMSPH